MATGFEVADHPVVYAVWKLKKVHLLNKWHIFHTVKGLCKIHRCQDDVFVLTEEVGQLLL